MPSKRHRIAASVSNGTPRGRKVRIEFTPTSSPGIGLNAELRRVERRVERGRNLSNKDAQLLVLSLGLLRDDLEEALDALGEYEDDIEELEGPCARCGGRGQADGDGRDEWANCPRCDGSGRVKSDV